MIKVCAGIASVGFVFLSGAVGCSSASTPDDGSGGGGSSATSTAGSKTTNNTAGTTVVPSGGTGSTSGGTGSTTTAGTASTAAGTDSGTAGTASTTGGTSSGTAGTGSGGTGATNPAACKGIKTGMACMPEGTDCPTLTCGLADSGTRACKCMSTWMCGSCDFSASPFKDKPADIMKCTGVEADKVTCTEKGKVCDGAAGGEVCACWTDDEGALIWDCDKPPTTWAAPAM